VSEGEETLDRESLSSFLPYRSAEQALLKGETGKREERWITFPDFHTGQVSTVWIYDD
jgi:hypothetical protein